MDNRKRHYEALELPKILEMLAQETSCEDSRLLAGQLEPSGDLETVRLRLKQTEDAFVLLARFGGPSFGGLKNVNNALSRSGAGGILNLRELLDIAEVLRVVRSLTQWQERCQGLKISLDPYFEGLFPNKYLEDKITSAILSEEEISDNASPELANIRRKIKNASAKVRDQLDKLTRSQYYQKFLQDSIVTMRGGRYVVPVKNEHRSEIPGLVHDTSGSGATVFIEPMAVVEANNEIKVLQSKESEEIERILYALSVEAGSFASSIKSSYECAVQLNFIFAKAHLAYRMKASVPSLNDEGITDLKNARHPLIDKNKVVPTNIRLGGDFDTLVITGPNTGGKTVSIKTLGLLTLMTMCGLMIPVADQSVISIYRTVLADIGDEQSIEQSLSTFSAHMMNIIGILKQADGHSLVLLDELGAGTDPVEGAALAMAILEDLHSKGAKIAATTHYAELKAYALQSPRVENGCCEFDVASLRPTYRLLIGVPGRSNAFAISERLGIAHDIVERAKELVSTENARFEDVVERLERSRQDMEQERENAQRLHAEAMQAQKAISEHKAKLQQQIDREMENARGEAKRLVDKARREAQAMVDELDKLRKEKNKENIEELARRAKSQMKSGMAILEDTADPVLAYQDDENYVLPRDLRLGDSVLIVDIGSSGTVAALPDKNGNVQVQTGNLKTRVKLQNLRLLGSSAKKEMPSTRNIREVHSRLTKNIKQELDLRGKTVDEALNELEMFLDTSMMAGIGQVTIIHGKGTGALRSAVQQHLRKHPVIKSFRLGVYGEGENGVTIVELK